MEVQAITNKGMLAVRERKLAIEKGTYSMDSPVEVRSEESHCVRLLPPELLVTLVFPVAPSVGGFPSGAKKGAVTKGETVPPIAKAK